MRDPLGDIYRGATLRGDECPLTLTNHVVERWAERTGRGLELDTVRAELSRMFSAMSVSRTPPDWFDAD